MEDAIDRSDSSICKNCDGVFPQPQETESKQVAEPNVSLIQENSSTSSTLQYFGVVSAPQSSDPAAIKTVQETTEDSMAPPHNITGNKFSTSTVQPVMFLQARLASDFTEKELNAMPMAMAIQYRPDDSVVFADHVEAEEDDTNETKKNKKHGSKPNPKRARKKGRETGRGSEETTTYYYGPPTESVSDLFDDSEEAKAFCQYWPKGWMKRITERPQRKSSRHFDSMFFSPITRKSFRSRVQVRLFLRLLKRCMGDEEKAWGMFKKW